ncbi:hypothetical protein KW425_06965 [Vibrio fluvialis]|nr:hypothetical protein [Vibrio fluvialis]
MGWLVLLAVVIAIAVWFKNGMSKSRKALKDPETFKKYCEDNGYHTLEEQQEFCERMGVDKSVINKVRNTPKANRQPQSKSRKSLEICFTGFPTDEKESLYELAESHGMTVRKDVTKYLDILCCGDTPGPVKIRKATEKSCMILSFDELTNMLDTGEVPERI